MLSFVFYYLLKNPDAYRKAQEEVDKVVGKESIRMDHLSKLPYITAVLRETARLQPTAPAFTINPKSSQGEIIGGKYFVEGDENVVLLLHSVHRDPEVYGPDAEEFRPERMLDENFNALPPNSWKPFVRNPSRPHRYGSEANDCVGKRRPRLYRSPVRVARDDVGHRHAAAVLLLLSGRPTIYPSNRIHPDNQAERLP